MTRRYYVIALSLLLVASSALLCLSPIAALAQTLIAGPDPVATGIIGYFTSGGLGTLIAWGLIVSVALALLVTHHGFVSAMWIIACLVIYFRSPQLAAAIQVIGTTGAGAI
jgi:type IV secretory pathway VirB2 component (pilin)